MDINAPMSKVEESQLEQLASKMRIEKKKKDALDRYNADEAKKIKLCCLGKFYKRIIRV